MGITIHYRGRLQDPAALPLLVQEVQLACGELGWPCQVVDRRIVGVAERVSYAHDPESDELHETVETAPVDDHWRGVVVQPPDCETLWLTFTREGQLVKYEPSWRERDKPGHYQVQECLAIKTQFSSPDVHIAVCSLLRVVERYAVEWEVEDEGGYWESGDREKLARRMERLYAALKMLASKEGRRKLAELLGEEDMEWEVEIGKRVRVSRPLWWDDWGVNAEEN